MKIEENPMKTHEHQWKIKGALWKHTQNTWKYIKIKEKTREHIKSQRKPMKIGEIHQKLMENQPIKLNNFGQ